MRTIRVHLPEQRAYDILIGNGLLGSVASLLESRIEARHVAVVTDEHLAESYGAPLRDSLRNAGWRAELVVLPAGEETKTLETLEKLYESFLDAGLDRTGAVLALGGGVVGDTAGFAASTYKRGVDLVQLPTTLLAQVDSSIGGKVAVNLRRGKNLVGAFHQPRAVVADVAALETLPEGELAAGMAEVVKYAIIMDRPLFEELEQRNLATLKADDTLTEEIVTRCAAIKAKVVAADEKESGLRAILNCGHTFAHAIETVSRYRKLSHGEAVAVGLVAAARLAERLGVAQEPVSERVERLLPRYSLPVALRLDTAKPVPSKELLEAMSHDKKVRDGKLRFILPVRIGEVRIVSDVREEDIAGVLQAL